MIPAEFVKLPDIVVAPVPLTAFANVPPFRVKLLLFVTVPLILLALDVIVPAFVIAPLSEPNVELLVKVTPLFTVTAWLIPAAFVVFPVTVVEPAPLTTLFNVPPEIFNLPAFDTLPPILPAFAVKFPAVSTVIAWLMAEFAVTVPVTFVVPAPLTVFDNVPALRVKVPAFDTSPPTLVALVVKLPAVVIAIA